MKRFVHLWFPYWPIERLRRERPRDISNDRALVLVTSGGRGIEISAVNREAAAQGLWVGQGLADARALLPGLVSLQAEPQADAAALEALAQWCGRYGPQRNVHDGCGIWIDVTGVAHLYGGEAGLLADAVRRLQGFGLTVRAGLADTPAAACVLARFAAAGGRGRGAEAFAIIEPGCLVPGLAAFPVEALRLDPDAVLVLKRLGLKRIGQLYDIPRASLQRRFNETHFGPGKGSKGAREHRCGKASKQELAGSVVLRLDQALGAVGEPLRPLAEPPVLSVRQSWTDPLISSEGIAAEVGELAARLVEQLGAEGLGCRHVRLSLYRADGTAAVVEAGTSMVCRDGDHLMGLLSERFSAIDAGFGIDVAELACVLAEPMQGTQDRLGIGEGGGAEEARALTRLVDRLVNRLGRSSVQMLETCQSHVPERAQRLLPARELIGVQGSDVRAKPERGGDNGPDGVGLAGCLDPGLIGCHAPHGRRADEKKRSKPSRPFLLLSPPEPIGVAVGGHRGGPVAFVWRRVHNRIVSCEGPERIAPEWWRDIGRDIDRSAGRSARIRDYYRVEAQSGARFWIFHELPAEDEGAEAPGVCEGGNFSGGRWLMHGLYGGGS